MMWDLPTSTQINGKTYTYNADYRDILEILEYLEKTNDLQTAILIALTLFYENFKEMPHSDRKEAWLYLCDFISCGETDDGRPKPKLVDWRQDYNIIAAEINKVASTEVRTLPFLHWFTFIGYYHSIGEGQLSAIVSIRQKRKKNKKLEKWELEFYQENKKKIDFQVKLSPEEEAEKERIKRLLGD